MATKKGKKKSAGTSKGGRKKTTKSAGTSKSPKRAGAKKK